MNDCKHLKDVETTKQNPKIETRHLSRGGKLFVWSARRWLIAGQRKEKLETVLGRTYQLANCPEAASLLDEIMSLIAIGAYRPVAIRCLTCPILSADEWALISVLRKLHLKESEQARMIIDDLMRGALVATLLRAAGIYADCLSQAGSPILSAGFLHVVDSNTKH